MSEGTVVVEYRDVRPDGAVLSSWLCPEGREFGNDYSQFGPGLVPAPPWDRQRREPGGEWVTVGRLRVDDGKERWDTIQSDGSIISVAEWWE